MTTTKKTLRKGRLIVSLDRNKVYPDDPGLDTPALVRSFGYCSTYWCACGEGELHHHNDGHTLPLTDDELDWLHSLDSEITEFLYR